jgi:hypothetical protein
MERSGGCLCGQVRYTLTGDPMAVVTCHCKNCQRQAGSAFSVVAVAASDAVRFTGTLKSYEDTAESGAKLYRKFCPECGSAMLSVLAENAALSLIKAGTFDEVDWISPQMNVWCASAQPWVALDPALPAFPGNPPRA